MPRITGSEFTSAEKIFAQQLALGYLLWLNVLSRTTDSEEIKMEAREIAGLITITHNEAYRLNANQTDKAYFYVLSGMRHLAETGQLVPEKIAQLLEESRTWAEANIS